MKNFKKILLVLFVVIALLLVLALFVPRKFTAEASIVIDKSQKEVFDYVRFMENQRNFSVWFSMDPNIQTTSEGVDGTEGYVLRWESEEVGNGSQSITQISGMDSVLTELDFGFGDPVEGFFKLHKIDPNQTEVTWGVRGTSPYPFNLVSLFISLDKDFETGTQNLKEVLESQVIEPSKFEDLEAYYDKTYTTLVQSTEGLSHDQLHFKPAPDRWSVAQCVEHIALTAPMLFEFLKSALVEPENPDRKSEVTMSDEDILAAMTNREYKAEASEDLLPSPTDIDIEGRLEELRSEYDKILEHLHQFDEEALRNRIMDVPFGAVDAYQFAIFIPGHTARHTLQIEEVKGTEGFPGE